MRDEPIRLHLRTTSVDPVAVDVTLLLAASSYIQLADGRSDPRAADAFDAVTSAYCNGAELYVPLPKTDVEAVPFFFNLWSQASALNTVPDLELTDEAYAAGATTLNAHLAVFMEGDAWDVARWTAFQFTQDIVESHLRRADMESIRRAGEAAAALIDGDRLPLLRNAISELQRRRQITIPEEYELLVGTRDIPSFFHLVVAYAISVSIRGCSYSIRPGAAPGEADLSAPLDAFPGTSARLGRINYGGSQGDRVDSLGPNPSQDFRSEGSRATVTIRSRACSRGATWCDA